MRSLLVTPPAHTTRTRLNRASSRHLRAHPHTQCKGYVKYLIDCPSFVHNICHEDMGGSERLRAPCPAYPNATTACASTRCIVSRLTVSPNQSAGSAVAR